jgi:hypothetical protein
MQDSRRNALKAPISCEKPRHRAGDALLARLGVVQDLVQVDAPLRARIAPLSAREGMM